jgi:hypothetical protein
MLKSTPFFYTDFEGIRFEKSTRIGIEDQDILSLAVICNAPSDIVKKSTGRARRTTSTGKLSIE